MKKNTVLQNAVLNVIKNVLSILFPLITYPYAARVIGVKYMGRISYANSIVSYFSLLAVFGITTYAIRECSKIRNNKLKLNRLASELFTLNLFTTFFSLVMLFVLILVVPSLRDYSLLISIQSLSIVFTTISVDWVNVVYEDYKYITIRGLLINIINLILLFTFVHNSSDFYIYAFLSVLSTILIGVFNYIYCNKYINLKFSISKKSIDHVKKLLPFFINEISVAIYVCSDNTMLGIMKGDISVGLYSVAVKVYSIIKGIFISIYAVTLPRLSNAIGNEEYDIYNKLLSNTISIFILLISPITIGLLIFSNDIIVLLAGNEYLSAATSLQLLSIGLLFAVFGGIVTRCINIPLGLEKNNTKASIIAGLENIVLNLPLIYYFSENGAAFSTVLAEATVLIYCVYKLKKENTILNIKISRNYIFDSVIGGLIVIATYWTFSFLAFHRIITLILVTFISIVLYGLFLFLHKNELFTGFIKTFLKRKFN